METPIFSQQGYKVLKTDDGVVMETPSGQRHSHPSASAAREHLVKAMKADGVYGKGSFGNAADPVGAFTNGKSRAQNEIGEKIENAGFSVRDDTNQMNNAGPEYTERMRGCDAGKRDNEQ